MYGNLTTKTSNVSGDLNVTGYAYGTSGKPHRVTSASIGGIANTLLYDGDGNITQYDAAAGNDTFIAYDGQNNVTQITVGTSGSTSTPTARDEFWYAPDGQRYLRRQSWDAAGTQKSNLTVSLGNFDEFVPEAGNAYTLVQRTQPTETVQYIQYTVPGGGIGGYWDYSYRDLLGSIDAIADGYGNLANKTSFDAYGGLRNKTWGSDIPSTDKDVLLTAEAIRYYRGFTGHEQLNRTGFIHMNGRVYDPRIGRFVSADPIVQAPGFSQSYNGYAYVFNSPASFTDPSGFVRFPSRDLTTDGGGRGEVRFVGGSLWASSGTISVQDGPLQSAIGSGTPGPDAGQTATAAPPATIPEASGTVPLVVAPIPDLGIVGGGLMAARILLPGYDAALNGTAALEVGSYGAATAWYVMGGVEVVLAGVTFGDSAVAFGMLRGGAAAAAKTIPRLSGDIARSFAGSRYHAKILQQDVIAFRYSGGNSPASGRFLTTQRTASRIDSPAAAQRALNLPAGATAEQVNSFLIPRGTTIYYGRVSGGGETATQIFIEDASVLRPFP